MTESTYVSQLQDIIVTIFNYRLSIKQSEVLINIIAGLPIDKVGETLTQIFDCEDNQIDQFNHYFTKLLHGLYQPQNRVQDFPFFTISENSFKSHVILPDSYTQKYQFQLIEQALNCGPITSLQFMPNACEITFVDQISEKLFNLYVQTTPNEDQPLKDVMFIWVHSSNLTTIKTGEEILTTQILKNIPMTGVKLSYNSKFPMILLEFITYEAANKALTQIKENNKKFNLTLNMELYNAAELEKKKVNQKHYTVKQ